MNFVSTYVLCVLPLIDIDYQYIMYYTTWWNKQINAPLPTHVTYKLGILDIDKFSRTLFLRWPWIIAWKDLNKFCAELDNPWNKENLSCFSTATRFVMGDGRMAEFGHIPLLKWCKPKDLLPPFFFSSQIKQNKVSSLPSMTSIGLAK
jgi:hypothetical protein